MKRSADRRLAAVSWLQDDIADQLLDAWEVLAHHHGGRFDLRTFEEHRFNFRKLDAEPANFDLAIDPSQKFKVTVRGPSHPIAGTVKASRAIAVARERMDNKFFTR